MVRPDKTKFEPSSEDIKCELQLSALDVWEPLKYEFDPQDILRNRLKHMMTNGFQFLGEVCSKQPEGLCLMGKLQR